MDAVVVGDAQVDAGGQKGRKRKYIYVRVCDVVPGVSGRRYVPWLANKIRRC